MHLLDVQIFLNHVDVFIDNLKMMIDLTDVLVGFHFLFRAVYFLTVDFFYGVFRGFADTLSFITQ